MKALNTNKGSVKINIDLLNNMSLEALKLFYSNFFPVAINNDNLYISREIEFHGFSEHFEPVSEATIPPNYEVIFLTDNKETMKIQFKKLV
ncbi:hypothetical protein T190115A13A_210002 [Tenacibaculum sp. 190524A02b]|uniref:Uncharacterized protein n=1 Tax=Tenacibaculum vairaonense TaxID=3137860 RepID=A0ABM9PL02_9FLAO